MPLTAQLPQAYAWSNPTSSGVVIRSGTEAARAFGLAWSALATEENRRRMAARDHRALLGSVEEQAAAFLVEAMKHPGLAGLYAEQVA